MILSTHKIFYKITQGNSRSVKVKKNILGMLLLKGGNILIGLLLVPMTLDYVDKECYGIWLTLSSMVAWIHFFDIGISNGLRNKLTEAMAVDNKILCKKYVSTTYALLTLIFIPLMVVLLFVIPYLNWSSLLNLNIKYFDELVLSISIIVVYFCINFILNTINTIILAEQRPADVALRQFFQQFVSLVIIYMLTKFTEGDLVKLCAGLCIAPLVVVMIYHFTLFNGRYNYMMPSIKSIDFSCASSLFKLGVQFFVIQIAAIIQYQAINFIILKYYGADCVTSYNISYKYFGILYMVWGILTTPLWSSTTDAIARNDYQWIKNIQKKYLKLLVLFACIGLVMLFICNTAYNIWVGDCVKIESSLSIWLYIYNIALMFGGLFVIVINGSGQLKIQTYASLVSPIIFILLCTLFINYNMGIYSILIAAIISNFNGLILAPMQCSRLLNRNIK